MLLTPLLAGLDARIAARLPSDAVVASLRYSSATAEVAPPRVVLVGYGRVGHTIGAVLAAHGIRYIACDALYRAGASNALPEAVAASLRLAEATLAGLGIAVQTAEAIVADVRSADYAPLRHADARPKPVCGCELID